MTSSAEATKIDDILWEGARIRVTSTSISTQGSSGSYQVIAIANVVEVLVIEAPDSAFNNLVLVIAGVCGLAGIVATILGFLNAANWLVVIILWVVSVGLYKFKEWNRPEKPEYRLYLKTVDGRTNEFHGDYGELIQISKAIKKGMAIVRYT